MLRLRLAAWRDGYTEGIAQAQAQRSAGYAEAIADVKAAEHGLVHFIRGMNEILTARWTVRGEVRTRETFADLHTDDCPRGALPSEADGRIWLSGPPVHYHQCTSVCYSYRPGWYAPPGGDVA